MKHRSLDRLPLTIRPATSVRFFWNQHKYDVLYLSLFHHKRRSIYSIISWPLNVYSQVMLSLYTLPYLSNPAFFIFGLTQHFSKIKNAGLDQQGTEPFEKQQFGTAGIEGVNRPRINSSIQRVSGISNEIFSPVKHRDSLRSVLTGLLSNYCATRNSVKRRRTMPTWRQLASWLHYSSSSSSSSSDGRRRRQRWPTSVVRSPLQASTVRTATIGD